MALQSQLFRGDKKLEACQLSHAAHITRGATGDHVSKIQKALLSVDQLIIDPGELAAKHYGSSTASAVLAYKSAPHRRIIGSYQASPDDIVGIKTITFLDWDMVQFEAAAGSASTMPPLPVPHAPVGAPGRGMCGPLREVANGFLTGSSVRVEKKGGMDAVFEFENRLPYETRVEITVGSGSPQVVMVAGTYGPFFSRATKSFVKLEPTPVSWNVDLNASSVYVVSPPAIPTISIPNPFTGIPVTTPGVTPSPTPVPRPVRIRWGLKTDWEPGEPPCSP